MTAAPAKICTHVIPAFGCEAYITKDRAAALEAFKRSNPAPQCPECNGPTVVLETDVVAMKIEYVCKDGDDPETGDTLCDGYMEVIVR